MTEVDRRPKILNARLRSTLLAIFNQHVERVNFEYYNVKTKRLCEESVYQLHERGIIALHQDGSITITDKGQWHVRYAQFSIGRTSCSSSLRDQTAPESQPS